MVVPIWMRLAREPGAGSGEQGKRERGAGIEINFTKNRILF
jgi:hypothetical protein